MGSFRKEEPKEIDGIFAFMQIYESVDLIGFFRF